MKFHETGGSRIVVRLVQTVESSITYPNDGIVRHFWHTSAMGQQSDDERRDEPSLELPSLKVPRFGQRSKRRTESNGKPEATGTDTTQLEPLNGAADRAETESTPRRARPSLPALPGPTAAAATGAVVGAFGTLMTYLVMAGCEAVRGTSSCGGPGLLLLVAILTLMILLGAAVLKAFSVAEPGSTSFLAVGVIAVIVLLVLLDSVFSGWMFLVVPTLAAASYALAHLVTTRFAEDA